jgi:hypothetical protein
MFVAAAAMMILLAAAAPADYRDTSGVRYVFASLSKPDWAYREEAGGRIQRFEVRSGDRGWPGDAANRNERSELITAGLFTTQPELFYRNGTDAWVSYAIKVEEGPPIISPLVVVGQMHPVADKRDHGSTDLRFQLGPTDTDAIPIRLFTVSDANPISSRTQPSVTRWQGVLRRGQWTRIVMHVVRSPFGRGALDLWIDGRRVLKLRDVAIGANNAENGFYWQYGIYRRENANPIAIDYANMEQGHHSLFARVNTPLAIPQ